MREKSLRNFPLRDKKMHPEGIIYFNVIFIKYYRMQLFTLMYLHRYYIVYKRIIYRKKKRKLNWMREEKRDRKGKKGWKGNMEGEKRVGREIERDKKGG